MTGIYHLAIAAVNDKAKIYYLNIFAATRFQWHEYKILCLFYLYSNKNTVLLYNIKLCIPRIRLTLFDMKYIINHSSSSLQLLITILH